MDDSDRLSVLQEELARRLGRQRYELWVGPHTSLTYDRGVLRVGCPTEFELRCLRSINHKTKGKQNPDRPKQVASVHETILNTLLRLDCCIGPKDPQYFRTKLTMILAGSEAPA